MLNLFHSSISRRTLLKVGTVSAAILAVPTWSTKVIAQVNTAVTSRVGSPKPDGLISFNAGWQVPIDDQKALLALEEKKIKEAQAAKPPAAPGAVNDATAPAKKSWGDKVQDTWGKVKNFF